MTGFESNLFSWTSATWNWLSQLELILNFTLLILGAALAFYKRRALWQWIIKSGRRPTDKTKLFDPQIIQQADKCKGLIVLFSREEQMSWLINQVDPSYVTLIVSKAGKFKDNATKLQSELLRKGINAQVTILNDISNVEHIKQMVLQIIRNYQEIYVEQMIVDVTGGTKTMSIGSYLAAKEAGEFVTYVSAPFTDVGKPVHSETKVISI